MAGSWFRGIIGGREAPTQIDTSVAHMARVYNYWLGGKDNFAADREAGDRAVEVNPDILRGVRANRAFLRRCVHYLAADAGIRQFLDIGTGLPAAGNTHEVAQRIDPQCRVLYVDNDPIVLTHARALLTGEDKGATAYLDADARDVDRVLAAVGRTLDPRRPVAVMLLLILHLIPDSDSPHRIVARLMEALPSGSYLALSHPTGDINPEANAEMGRRLNERTGPVQGTVRSHGQVQDFFAGLEILEPGVVPLNRWRPEAGDGAPGPDVQAYCGVARKR